MYFLRHTLVSYRNGGIMYQVVYLPEIRSSYKMTDVASRLWGHDSSNLPLDWHFPPKVSPDFDLYYSRTFMNFITILGTSNHGVFLLVLLDRMTYTTKNVLSCYLDDTSMYRLLEGLQPSSNRYIEVSDH